MRSPLSRSIEFLFLVMVGSCAAVAKAEEFRYCYISFYAALPPEIVVFDPKAIDSKGRVYGNAYKCAPSTCDQVVPYIGVYEDGAVTVRQPTRPAMVYAANDNGTIGGSVLIDLETFVEQAALFRGKSVEFISPQPGEAGSAVIMVNNRGVAVARSSDAVSARLTYLLYKRGHTTPIEFSQIINNPTLTGINDLGVISGTAYNGNSLAFHFTPRMSLAKLLYPVPTEPNAWGLGINNRSDVVGYSFIVNGLERIGVWNWWGVFKTYFVEGTPEFPTVSNSLVFNDRNQIAISWVTSPASERLKNSYLIPKPGIRLNVASLVANLPSGASLSQIVDINDRGDMIGLDFYSGDSFLLKRDGRCRSHPMGAFKDSAQSSQTSSIKRRAITSAVASLLHSRPSLLKPGADLP